MGMNVVYLSLGQVDSSRYVENLRAFGFSVKLHHDLSGARATDVNDRQALFVVQAPAASMRISVEQLRRTFCYAGIVAISNFPDESSCTAVLMAGADSCVEGDPESWELMATLLACQRRMQRQARLVSGARVQDLSVDHVKAEIQEFEAEPGQKQTWRLGEGGWSMVAPNGATILMSRVERDLMTYFFEHAQTPVLTSDLEAIFDSANSDGETGVDAVISKLRRKASQLSLRLPIHRIRGTGYVFAIDESM